MYPTKKWEKLTPEQIREFGFYPYNGEVILILIDAETMNPSFYFNAQKHFSDDDIASMEDHNEGVGEKYRGTTVERTIVEG